MLSVSEIQSMTQIVACEGVGKINNSSNCPKKKQVALDVCSKYSDKNKTKQRLSKKNIFIEMLCNLCVFNKLLNINI